jgi:hypothetical protein
MIYRFMPGEKTEYSTVEEARVPLRSRSTVSVPVVVATLWCNSTSFEVNVDAFALSG